MNRIDSELEAESCKSDGIGVESCRLCMRPALDITCIYMYIAVQGKFMKLRSLPCYCATVRQVARAVTVLYEELLADSGLHATPRAWG